MKRKIGPVINPIPYIIKLDDDQKSYDQEFKEMIYYLMQRDFVQFQKIMRQNKLKKKDLRKLNYNANTFREILQVYIKTRGNSAEVKYRGTKITYPYGRFTQC